MHVEYTIDELARVAETTVRSVRVYHERGLLPSPEIRGRIGYYSDGHLHRLQTIGRLLSRGMKLNGIRELLEAWDRGEGLADVLGVQPAPGDSAPEPHAVPALESAPDSAPTRRLRRMPGAGPIDRLIAAGLSPTAAHALVERLRVDCGRIADHYADELTRGLSALPAGTASAAGHPGPGADAAWQLITHAIAELVGNGFARPVH